VSLNVGVRSLVARLRCVRRLRCGFVVVVSWVD
jgi:hypothetical protein